jgi:superfamily II DNA or RNA helicase
MTDIQTIGSRTLLVADEVHNLGRASFIFNPPSFFDYRLGLSATPVRQYDDEGTAELFSFFGPVVFRYSLQDAIGSCLVEYDYHVHQVTLTDVEMDAWYELTDNIKGNSWRQENDPQDEYLMQLRRKRRTILESAANKIPALDDALRREDLHTLCHTLIYTSDKSPDQLDQVNALLQRHNLLYRQLTYRETADRRTTADILQSFRDGTLRILTAKRVLDEGVNIPEVRKAFILASTTVERQWVQRRGRLLRKCLAIGKTHAEVHDFVVLPPSLESADADVRVLLRAELTRIQEFASLARNAGRSDGPLPLIRKLARAALM